jgi:hypothetical protein
MGGFQFAMNKIDGGKNPHLHSLHIPTLSDA